MKVFKLAAGLAVGYVLGSRAGRERYEQIVAAARKAQGHPAVAEIKQKAKELTGTAASKLDAPTEPASSVVPAVAVTEPASAVVPAAAPVEPASSVVPTPATTTPRPARRPQKSPLTSGTGTDPLA